MATSSSTPKPSLATIGPKSRAPRLINPFQVLAFDPGGTTGWSAVALLEPKMSNELELVDFYFTCGEFTGGEHHSRLFAFIQNLAELEIPLHLVTEAFTFRQHATDGSFGKAKVELISCEYIGIIKLAAEMFHLPIASYMSSEGKNFVTDLKLDKLGWMQYPKTPKRHTNDASRQLVSYLVKKLRIHHPITTTWRD
jgi:hypothetical protein